MPLKSDQTSVAARGHCYEGASTEYTLLSNTGYLFRSSFLKAINTRPKWRAIKDAVDIEGWRIVGLLRLASPVPGTATNYLFGLTRISLWQYTAATIAGSMPQTFLFVYLGTTGNAALRAESWFKFSVMLASVGFALAVCWLIAQRTRAIFADRAMSRSTD